MYVKFLARQHRIVNAIASAIFYYLLFILRLNEAKLQLKTVGLVSMMGSECEPQASSSGTHLSADLGDINLNRSAEIPTETQEDDIFL